MPNFAKDDRLQPIGVMPEKIRQKLFERSQAIQGQELEQRVNPAGMGVYGNDYYQRQMERAQAYQQQQAQLQPAQIDNADPYREQMDQWRNQQGGYANAKTGPNGEALPAGAQHFDYYGRPYYGDGLAGWWNGFMSRLTAPIGKRPDEIVARREQGAVSTPMAYRQGGQGEQVIDVGKTASNIGQALTQSEITPLAYASRAVGGVLSGGLEAIQVPAKATEQSVGMQAQAGQLGAGSPLPDVNDLPTWTQYFLKANPALFAGYQDVRMWTSPKFRAQLDTDPLTDIAEGRLPFVKEGSEIDDAWQAGRIAYSNVIDPQSRAEYIRRLNAGENPVLLAQELENPLAEAAGQILLDPLNLIGGGTRHARDLRRIADVSDEFLKAAPEVAAVLNRGQALSEAEAAGNILDAARAQMAFKAQVARGVDDLASKRGLLALTADGARWQVNRTTGEMARYIAANADPEDAADMFKALVLAASDREQDVAEGITLMKNFQGASPTPLFSRAGTETGVILRRMLADDTGAVNAKKFLDGVQEARTQGVDALVEFMQKKLGGAIDEMFPTVTERLKLAKQAAGGKALKPWQVPLAKVSPGMEALARFDAVAQRAVFRPVNGFFANVYMGLSPGYAFRNAIQNYTQIAIDLGPRAIFRRPAAALENVKGWLGGAVPGGAQGFGSAAAVTAKRFGMTKVAEKVEANAAKVIISHEVEKVMRRMLQPGRALPDVRPLVEAGMDQATAQALVRSVIGNKGDVGRAVTAMKQALKTGEIDLLTAMTWLTRQDDDALRGFNLLDDVAQRIQDGRAAGKTADEITADVSSVFDDLLRQGDNVAEPVVVAADAPVADAVLAAADDAPTQGQTIATNYIQATHVTDKLSVEAARDAIRVARSQGVDVAAAEQRLDAILRDGDALWERANEFKQLWVGRKRRLDNLKGRGELTAQAIADLWRDTQLGTEVPANWSEFASRFWMEFFYPKVHEMWTPYRERLFSVAEGITNDLGQGRLIEAARDANRRAGILDGLMANYHRSEFRVLDAIEKGNIPNAVRAMADQLGVATISERGVPADKALLRIINANLDEGAAAFDDLAAVDPEQARRALARHATKERQQAARAVAEAAPVVEPVPAPAPEPVDVDRAEWDEIQRRRTTLLNRWSRQALGSIDQSVARSMVDEAGQMLDEVPDIYEGGLPITDPVTEKIIGRTQSNYPKWVQDLQIGGKRVSKALQKIIAGGDLDTGADVDRLKDLIITRLERSNRDPRIHLALGNERKAYQILSDQIGAIDLEQRYGITDAEKLTAFYRDADPDNLRDLAPLLEEVTNTIPTPPYAGDIPPTPGRVVAEQAQGIRTLKDRVLAGIRENYGRVQETFDNPQLQAALDAWGQGATRGVSEARIVAANVANAARDFALLPYGKKRGLDLALAYVFPYQFWYSRTYANWLQRLVQVPDVIAGYAKYKEALAKIHAGAPDWWKWNVNTNELLGLDSENPLFFNLEATLNPLNGLTGVDFNDPDKRVSWWTRTLDDIGKFGPSPWSPLSIATGVALSMQGEEDAAARWTGRLIPQTATLKSLLALPQAFGGETIHLPDTPFTAGNELDPLVNLFSGGLDPYERRRVGRALAAMVQDGQITEAQALEAGRAQKGDVWERAIDRATATRAPGQLGGFLAGVGFKGRSTQDVLIDKFYSDYGRLRAMRTDYSPEEYRRKMDELRSVYPFMDTVLLSRNTGPDRDNSYAYNVLGRIPPGQRDDILKAVGVAPDLYGKFYDDKGVDKWVEADRTKFMTGIVELGALLDLPDDATRGAWREASAAYGQLTEAAERLFGADIWERVDKYYAAKGETYQDKQRAEAILNADPQISQALDWKAGILVRDPRLSPYYASIDKVESYHRGGMYAEIKRELGADIWDKWDEYSNLRLESPAQAKAYWKAHPELEKYGDIKDKWEAQFEKMIASTASKIPEGYPAALRPDLPGELSSGQVAALDLLQGGPEYGWGDYEQMMSPTLQEMVLSYIGDSEELSSQARKQLDYLAGDLGISTDVLLAQMRLSLPMQRQAVEGGIDVSTLPGAVSRQLLLFYQGGPALGSGARKVLRAEWEKLGRPGGSFDEWVDGALRAQFAN